MLQRLAILTALILGGCTRAGFFPDDSEAPADGRLEAKGGRDTAGAADRGAASDRQAAVTDAATYQLTNANESCSSALVVDMSSVTTAYVTVDPTGASSDLGIACCFGAPDLVIWLKGAGASITATCIGSGSIITVDDTVCPSGATSCYSSSCSGAKISGTIPSQNLYLVVCRAAASGSFVLKLVKS